MQSQDYFTSEQAQSYIGMKQSTFSTHKKQGHIKPDGIAISEEGKKCDGYSRENLDNFKQKNAAGFFDKRRQKKKAKDNTNEVIISAASSTSTAQVYETINAEKSIGLGSESTPVIFTNDPMQETGIYSLSECVGSVSATNTSESTILVNNAEDTTASYLNSLSFGENNSDDSGFQTVQMDSTAQVTINSAQSSTQQDLSEHASKVMPAQNESEEIGKVISNDTNNSAQDQTQNKSAEALSEGNNDTNLYAEIIAGSAIAVNAAISSTSVVMPSAEPPAQIVNGVRKDFHQTLENLPQQLRDMKCFLPTNPNKPKAPAKKNWQNPDVWEHLNEIESRPVAFIAASDNVSAPSYDCVFIDFDHCLNENYEFIDEAAEKLFDTLNGNATYYAELSQSRHGLHMFLHLPKGFKGKKISHKIFFYIDPNGNKELDRFVEIFYHSTKNCLLSGERFSSNDKSTVAKDDTAVSMFNLIANDCRLSSSRERAIAKMNEQAKVKSAAKYHDIKREEEADSEDDKQNEIVNIIAAVNAIDPVVFAKAFDIPRDNLGKGFQCIFCGNGTGKSGDGVHPRFSEGKWKWKCFSANCTSPELDNLSLAFQRLYQEGQISGTNLRNRDFVIALAAVAERLEIKHNLNIRTTRKFLPSSPIDLIIPNGYKISEKEISCEDRKGEKIIIAERPILPVKVSHAHNGEVSYILAILTQGRWKELLVDGYLLGNSLALAQLINGDGGYIAEGKLFAKFIIKIIAANEGKIPCTNIFRCPGWHEINGVKKFIYPSADVEIANESGLNYATMFTQHGDKQKWLELFKSVTRYHADNPLGYQKRLFLGAALSAPLIGEVIHTQNPSWHLYGRSCSGKSTLVKLALSVFGNPADGELFRTWEATKANRKSFCSGLNGLPICLDEVEVATKSTELAAEIYSFSLGVGNQKNSKLGKQRQTVCFHSVQITTGERPMLNSKDKLGARTRLVEIHTNSKLFEGKEAKTCYITASQNYGFYGREWTEYIAENREEISAAFDSLVELFSDTSVVQKTVEFICTAAVAFGYFYSFVTGNNFKLMTAYSDADTLINEQPTVTEIDDCLNAIQALSSWIDSNPGRIREETDVTEESYLKYAQDIYAVLFADGTIGFYPNALEGILTNPAPKGIGLSCPEKFLSDATERGIIITEKSSRSRTKLKRIKGLQKRQRFYIFKREVFGYISVEKQLNESKANYSN